MSVGVDGNRKFTSNNVFDIFRKPRVIHILLVFHGQTKVKNASLWSTSFTFYCPTFLLGFPVVCVCVSILHASVNKIVYKIYVVLYRIQVDHKTQQRNNLVKLWCSREGVDVVHRSSIYLSVIVVHTLLFWFHSLRT